MLFRKQALFLLTAFILTGTANAANSSLIDSFFDKVVYGEDNRKDLYEVFNPMHLRLAKSTAIQVLDKDYTYSNGYYQFSKTLSERMNVCSTERFADQIAPGNCSGFLVGEDLLVTAGHCMKSENDCKNAKWIFDLSTNDDGSSKDRMHESSVYTCSQIIGQQLTGYPKVDYAIIKLDRKVTGRKPLKVRTAGKIKDNQSIVVIGHPSGLPTKVSDGAEVTSNGTIPYFTANLDTFGGNSGSAVFNDETGEVEGILVRGARDYVSSGDGCYVVNTCENDPSGGSCAGEGVTRITEVLELMDIILGTGDDDIDDADLIVSEKEYTNLGKEIKDKETITQSIYISSSITNIRDLSINVKLSHTYVGDLTLTLVHHSGTELVLRAKKGGSADDIDQTFGRNGTLIRSIRNIKGLSAAGIWTLKINDNATGDTGFLESVKLQVYGI